MTVPEIDLDASEGYLKYTVTLAGVGFAFAQTRIGTLPELFGGVALLGMPLTTILLFALIVLFFASSVLGLAAISAIAGAKNDAAAFGALSPGRKHAALMAHRAKRARRMGSARRNFNWHLFALIAGFCVAAAVFLAEVVQPDPDPPLCQSRIGDLRLTYPCDGSPEDVFETGRITP